MTALSENSRGGVVRYRVALSNHHPMLDHTPARTRELMRRAVGGTHEDILACKRQIVERRLAIHKARAHVANAERHLSRIGAQHVVACTAPGYTEPQHRLDQAAADKAAGLSGPLTWEDCMKIKRGEMAPPTWDNSRPMYSEIHAMKHHIVHHTTLADLAQALNDHAESHLHSLDPQAVVKAKVADYLDPSAIVAAAREATQETTP
jgi:hypothetical protein